MEIDVRDFVAEGCKWAEVSDNFSVHDTRAIKIIIKFNRWVYQKMIRCM